MASPHQYYTNDHSGQSLLFQSRKTSKTAFPAYYAGTKLRKQWRSKYQVGLEFIPVLPTKMQCPNMQSSIPKAVTHQWMAVSWASHSSWPIFNKPSFPSLPAEQRSSCLTHSVITAWEAASSAGEGSSPREMQILHTWSKRTAIPNFDFVKHYAKLSNA